MKKSSKNIENVKRELNRVLSEYPITNFLNYRSWLESIYNDLKESLRPYSYQQFSNDLNLGSSNVHLVISGRRKLTVKTGAKVAKALALNGADKKYLDLLIGIDVAKDVVERDEYFKKLMDARVQLLASQVEKEELEFFTDWYHAAIIELLRLPESQDKPEWISAQLNPKVPLYQVKRSLELLNKLGYLTYNADKGKLFPTDAKIRATQSTSRLAVLSLHNQMLDLAKAALTGFKPKDREISTVTLAIDESAFKEIKEKLIATRKDVIEASLKSKNPDSIVQVNFQLFPLCDQVEPKKQ